MGKAGQSIAFSFPPLVLHGDPLAAALVGRSPGGGLSQHTLRAALVLNATRISTILTSWFPSGEGVISKPEFLSVLAALGLHAEGGVAGDELFDSHLDMGDGTTSVRKLLTLVVGPAAMRARTKRSEPRLRVHLPGLQPDRKAAQAAAATRGGDDGEAMAAGSSLSAARALGRSSSEPSLPKPPQPSMAPRAKAVASTPSRATAAVQAESSKHRSPLPPPASQLPPPPPPVLDEQAGQAEQAGQVSLRIHLSERTLPVRLELRVDEGAPSPGRRSERHPARRRACVRTGGSSPPPGGGAPPGGGSPEEPTGAASVAQGRTMTPLPRPAIGPQWSSEKRSTNPSAFGKAPRACIPDESRATLAEEGAAAPQASPHAALRRPGSLLPKVLRPYAGVITQAELNPPIEEIAPPVETAAPTSAPAKSSLAGWNKARGLGNLLGTLANAAQADKAPTKLATPAEIARLLEASSEVLDEIVHTLSDWDSEYRGDGTVSKRNFRRALPLHGVPFERHVADALFESLLPKAPPAEVEAAEGAPLQVEVKKKETMEIWMLDRGIRWGEGSKAKRSKLLNNTAGLFQDANKSVAEQLRDALVANAMRVMDLFREWDDNGDGQITKDEFKKAIPKLGLTCPMDAVDALFDEFDLDRGGTITFRELNKQLRRDVKAEVKVRVKDAEPEVQIADVDALRRSIKYGLLNIMNTEIFAEDPLTGERISS